MNTLIHSQPPHSKLPPSDKAQQRIALARPNGNCSSRNKVLHEAQVSLKLGSPTHRRLKSLPSVLISLISKGLSLFSTVNYGQLACHIMADRTAAARAPVLLSTF